VIPQPSASDPNFNISVPNQFQNGLTGKMMPPTGTGKEKSDKGVHRVPRIGKKIIFLSLIICNNE